MKKHPIYPLNLLVASDASVCSQTDPHAVAATWDSIREGQRRKAEWVEQERRRLAADEVAAAIENAGIRTSCRAH